MALTGSVLNAALLRGVSSARFLLQVSALHGSSGSRVLEAATTSAAAAQPNLSEELAEGRRVKSLREMPGPSAIGNLMEFFYRDGFSRIHEIQVGVRDTMSQRARTELPWEWFFSSSQAWPC